VGDKTPGLTIPHIDRVHVTVEQEQRASRRGTANASQDIARIILPHLVIAQHSHFLHDPGCHSPFLA